MKFKNIVGSHTGRILLAAGSSGMSAGPDLSSSQGWLVATFPAVQPAATVARIAGAGGPDGG